MERYFVKDYTGAPFVLFGPAHLATMAIVLAINLALYYFHDHLGETFRRRFRFTLATILLVNEVAWHAWNLYIDDWTIQTMLPFHICSVFVYLGAYMLVTRNYSVYEYAYFLGIGAAMQALLTPDAGPYGFPHFRYLQTVISHGAIVTSAVYMTVVEGYRPTVASIKRVLIGTNLYMAAIFVLNQAIGSNYLFIAHKPETASLIDVLGPWPWYILSMEAIGVVMCLLLYLPFALRDRGAARTPQAEMA